MPRFHRFALALAVTTSLVAAGPAFAKAKVAKPAKKPASARTPNSKATKPDLKPLEGYLADLLNPAINRGTAVPGGAAGFKDTAQAGYEARPGDAGELRGRLELAVRIRDALSAHEGRHDRLVRDVEEHRGDAHDQRDQLLIGIGRQRGNRRIPAGGIDQGGGDRLHLHPNVAGQVDPFEIGRQVKALHQ